MATLDPGRPIEPRLRAEDYQLLALRLIMANLCEDPEEVAYHVWSIQYQTEYPADHFELAATTAREAASWWRRTPEGPEKARAMITRKLEKLTARA